MRIAIAPAAPLLSAPPLAALLLTATFLTLLLIAPFLAILAEGRPLAVALLATRFGPPLTLIAALPTLALAPSKFPRRTAPVPALMGLPLLCSSSCRLTVRSNCAVGRGLRPIAMLAVSRPTRTAALLAAATRSPDLDELRLGRRGGSFRRPVCRRCISRGAISRSSLRRHGRRLGGFLHCGRLGFRFGRGTGR
jgi:hypothetical protein